LRAALLSLGIVLLGILQAPLPSISGRVRNVGVFPAGVSLGQPFSNMRVAIGTIGYSNGRRTFTSRLTAQADATGNYRLSNVNPGEYYLRAELPQLLGLAAYYPGTRDVDAAIKVAVQPGEEIVAMDFDSNNGPMFKISGTVQNLSAAATVNGLPTIIGFTFVSTDRRSLDPSASPLIPSTGLKPNGEFELSLPAGEWDIFPVANRAAGAPVPVPGNLPAFTTGRARVLLKDRDVENVVIKLGSADIKGRMVVPGFSPEQFARVSSMQVFLLPKDNYPAPLVQHLRPVTVGSSGEFVFTSVPPGRYVFQIPTIPSDLYVADIRIGAKSIYEDGILTVGAEPTDPIEVVLSTNGGIVRATPASPAGPRSITAISAAGVFSGRIVLIPVDRRENGLIYKAVFAGSEIPGVAPGRYQVFAFQQLPSGGAEQDPDFMKPYEDFGVTISVAGGQTVDVQVPWIPAGK